MQCGCIARTCQDPEKGAVAIVSTLSKSGCGVRVGDKTAVPSYCKCAPRDMFEGPSTTPAGVDPTEYRWTGVAAPQVPVGRQLTIRGLGEESAPPVRSCEPFQVSAASRMRATGTELCGDWPPPGHGDGRGRGDGRLVPALRPRRRNLAQT